MLGRESQQTTLKDISRKSLTSTSVERFRKRMEDTWICMSCTISSLTPTLDSQ
ncbi:hypothetical protein M758_4G045100 [Ceratodon purpureus]|uniref:Uncharacterized protein n=1 Tax=Ceratodon purpureus TaxID=3225 RepID=A0A8T0I5Q0_CERPU|nr:hypothetical protein KC19_4G048100 [Ceratodon purpureus]KAG0618189.1 hypothetical protein M758_4G045100 [Ceratodon purpureus]